MLYAFIATFSMDVFQIPTTSHCRVSLVQCTVQNAFSPKKKFDAHFHPPFINDIKLTLSVTRGKYVNRGTIR